MDPATTPSGRNGNSPQADPTNDMDGVVSHQTPAQEGANTDTTQAASVATVNGALRYQRLNDRPINLKEAPVENFRPMRVICIGAGYSGIYVAIRIPERLRNIDLTVYEKNADVGGTWYENRYPGCACDIPGMADQRPETVLLTVGCSSFVSILLRSEPLLEQLLCASKRNTRLSQRNSAEVFDGSLHQMQP